MAKYNRKVKTGTPLKLREYFAFSNRSGYAIIIYFRTKINGAELISFLKSLITTAGKICLEQEDLTTANEVVFKNPKDLVTPTDKKVESHIIQKIETRYPGHDILGEETGKTKRKSPYLWIIDPIDGTTSFFHNQPFYSVSISLEKKGIPIMGAVYAPVLDQLFYAEKEKGAFLNDIPIKVSGTKHMINSVMATGFACLRAGLEENNLANFNAIVPKLRDIRRYGSAALDLCYVACGKLDGFWELNLNIYDISAGALILKEAGGIVSDFSGRQNYPDKGIAAANSYLHPQLLSSLKPLGLEKGSGQASAFKASIQG